jgi:hypothetical protein
MEEDFQHIADGSWFQGEILHCGDVFAFFFDRY